MTKQKTPSAITKRKIWITAVIFILFTALVLAAAFCPYLLDNAESVAAKETRLTYTDYSEDGENTLELCGSEVVNLKDLNSVLFVNHTPGAFTDPFSLKGNPERVDVLTKADFGTLQFVFFNIDPTATDFQNQVDSVSGFRLGNENLINISLYLPACFDAATVYAFNSYVSTAGDMGEYDPLDFVDPYLSDSFQINENGVAPQTVELTFSTARKTIPPDRFEAARVVTVHYRAKGGVSFQGNLPLAGTKAAIKSATDTKTNAHIALVAFTAVVAVSFAFLLLLKRKTEYVGQLGILLGAVLLLGGGLIPSVGVATTGATLSAIAVAVIMFFAVLSAAYQGNFTRRNAIVIGLSFVNLIVSVVLSFIISYGAVSLYMIITASILAASSVVFGFRKWRKEGNQIAFIGILTACTSGLLAAFLPFAPLSTLHPAEAVGAISALVVLSLVFIDIFVTERRNAALTENLQAEVTAQTAVLANAVADREKILSFLSHDMKKSALGIKALTEEMIRNAPDDSVRNTADKIETKNQVLLSSFSEILRFTKQSFSDEQFSSFSLNGLLSELTARVRPDCEANGIAFTVNAKKLTVRAKRSALLSVLFNLVFNAIEHSGCTNIDVSAKKSGSRVLIKVTDDGKGIGSAADIFNPYVSENAEIDGEQNTGLGLFIVKSQIEAMGGTISYETENGSVFTLALLSE